jgi:hypothetical protein
MPDGKWSQAVQEAWDNFCDQPRHTTERLLEHSFIHFSVLAYREGLDVPSQVQTLLKECVPEFVAKFVLLASTVERVLFVSENLTVPKFRVVE